MSNEFIFYIDDGNDDDGDDGDGEEKQKMNGKC